MNPLSAVGMGLSGIGALGSMFGIKKANRRIDNLLAADPQRSTEGKGLLQNLYNGRMAGASAAERNIFGNQASFLGNVGRNASDASQALSLAAGAQGQTDQALEGLATQEAQNRLNFINPILSENDALYQDQVRRYGDKVSAENIKAQNRQAPWQTIQNLGASLTGFGATQDRTQAMGKWFGGAGMGMSGANAGAMAGLIKQ